MRSPGRCARASLVVLLALVVAAHVPAVRVAAQPSPGGPEQGALWVQLPNHGGPGRLAPDFHEMFTTRTRAWAQARGYIRVFVLRSTSLRNPENGITDKFLRDAFLPKLKAWRIALALNVVGAGHAQCGNKAQVMFEEAEQIDRIRRLGGEVKQLSMQSVLSKPSDDCPEYGRDTGYDLRIADAVRYVEYMKGRYPGIAVGMVDAMPAKGWDYQPVYRQLVAALEAEGLALDFLHLDFPLEAADAGWANARAAEDFVRNDLGIKVGLIYVSAEGGETSDEAFYAGVLEAYRGFREAGGRPDRLVLTSWYPHPTANLPERSASGHPFMKLVLDFAGLGGVRPNRR